MFVKAVTSIEMYDTEKSVCIQKAVINKEISS